MDEQAYLAVYKKLNQAQKKAVDTLDGPVLVVAGPGTGKTELLALRVANILRLRDVSPHNILCLTFTENGALNMRNRLASFIKQDAYRVGIYTFHAFANSIISRNPEYFYQAANFSQASDLDRAQIFTEIFETLPHKHALASFHSEEGYVYLKDMMDRIKHIKSGGYTPSEYSALVESIAKEYPAINKVLHGWPEGRASIKNISLYDPIVQSLHSIGTLNATYLATTLAQSIERASENRKMEAISDWKKKYTINDGEQVVLKDSYLVDKIRGVAEIYSIYTEMLHKKGLYDFDDVIIEVGHVLRNNSVLKNELEEQYQYILIDEFQDTNDAQMSLVHAISSSYIHEGRPNVMVVGDDDQAVYKFQGAEISNIINFRNNTYKNVEIIVLDKNYRSHQAVLDLARSIVTQGIGRLENKYGDISKVLSQGNASIKESKIAITEYGSDIEEFTRTAQYVHKLILDKQDPKEIAIISRGHKELRALLPFLDQLNIPYEYVKKANVFDEPHIDELVTICMYVSSVVGEGERMDHFLPKILSFPYFSIDRKVIFSIALEAKESRKSWAEVISTSEDIHVTALYKLLSELTKKLPNTPLEHFLEYYMQESGFRRHYFGEEILATQPTQYIYFLSSLKTFIEAMREWREGEMLFAKDVGQFVRMHREHDLSLISESPFTKNDHSIQLLTAHAAKGLEFAHVFVIAAHDDLWTRTRRTNKAPIPAVLAPLLTPAGDSEDDFIRLFYVAITRAKQTLMVSGHKPLIRYLSHEQSQSNEHAGIIDISAHENALSLVAAPYQKDEWAILKKLVENYFMPVTHLANFLNIVDGGPLFFIEQNLLRFPQPMNVSGVFGSAIHKAIAELIMYPKYHAGETPSEDHILATFSQELARGRLPHTEFTKQRKRGIDVLKKYVDARNSYFVMDDQVELDMKNQGVTLHQAVLTGKIDFLRIKEGKFHVVDFKTGRTFTSWEATGMTDTDKIKLHKFKQQLIYYKILLEHSVEYTQPIASLAIEFVESVAEHNSPVILEYSPSDDEVARTEKLIATVYKKITALEFPDISEYEKNYKGILAFEQALIDEG